MNLPSSAIKRLTVADLDQVSYTRPVRFGLKDHISEVNGYRELLYSVVKALENGKPGHLKQLAMEGDRTAKKDARVLKVTQRDVSQEFYLKMGDGVSIYKQLSSIDIISRIQWFLEQYQISLDAFWVEVYSIKGSEA